MKPSICHRPPPAPPSPLIPWINLERLTNPVKYLNNKYSGLCRNWQLRRLSLHLSFFLVNLLCSGKYWKQLLLFVFISIRTLSFQHPSVLFAYYGPSNPVPTLFRLAWPSWHVWDKSLTVIRVDYSYLSRRHFFPVCGARIRQVLTLREVE